MTFGVNFINVKRTRFSYERHLGSFSSYIYVVKAAETYVRTKIRTFVRKFVRLMLMKLTNGRFRQTLCAKQKNCHSVSQTFCHFEIAEYFQITVLDFTQRLCRISPNLSAFCQIFVPKKGSHSVRFKKPWEYVDEIEPSRRQEEFFLFRFSVACLNEP